MRAPEAPEGHDRLQWSGGEQVAWAESRMPVLGSVRERFERERPFESMRIGCCLHVTAETAVLLGALLAGGAEVSLAASNPLSTNDAVSTYLSDLGVATHARHGEGQGDLLSNIDGVLDSRPTLTVDDGCDLLARLHVQRRDRLEGVIGGTEDTTTGALRLRGLAAGGVLAYPVLAVSNSTVRLLADNRHGAGQSTIAAILSTLNTLVAGSTVVVAGYGNCGKAIADIARGMGATVLVTEVQPLQALAAILDGHRVVPMDDAASRGDIFVTATGNREVLTGRHFAAMRDGAVLANAGQFDLEIDLPGLERAGGPPRRVRPMVDEYVLRGVFSETKRLLLLAEGRVVNLAAGEGNAPGVMDLAFSVQALSCEWLARNAPDLEAGVYDVPEAIDTAVARLKLEALGVSLDHLTREQAAYLESWGR